MNALPMTRIATFVVILGPLSTPRRNLPENVCESERLCYNFLWYETADRNKTKTDGPAG